MCIRDRVQCLAPRAGGHARALVKFDGRFERNRQHRAWVEFGDEGLVQPAAGHVDACLLYTSDAADERSSVDLGGRRFIKKKTHVETQARRERNTTDKN